MNWKDIPAGTINFATQRFWVALKDDADLVANRMKNDSDFVNQVALFARKNSFQPSIYQKRARDIMGSNFFGVEEAIKHFEINPSRAQAAALSDIPFTEEVLASCKDTHILVAIFPISILDIRSRVARKLFFYHKEIWYREESFAKKKGKVGWRLVRRTPVPDSISKIWNEQQALLDRSKETPSVRVMVYTIIGHFLATGERLFKKVYVRTSSKCSADHRVGIGGFGGFGGDGLRIYGWWDDRRNGKFGLSSARKP